MRLDTTCSIGFLLLAGCVGLPVPSRAAVRHVPAEYATIQTALNVSTAGDIILVAPGTYVGALQMTGAQSGVQLRSTGGPDVTIIDGNKSGSTIYCQGVGASTTIEGFTITGGAAGLGGGIHLSGADVAIRGNIIRENTANVAGGLYVDYSSPVIEGNTITLNSAPYGSGGGIYCDHGANAQILNNVITDNTCGAYGGGVTAWQYSYPVLTGNTIVGNQAVMKGGGLFANDASSMSVTRTIVVYNNLNGVEVSNLSSITLLCCDVYGNEGADFVGMDDPTGLDGNIKANPLFCSRSSGDLHISELSPCADGKSPEGCGLIGALGPLCQITPVVRTTWGQVKAGYAK